MLFRTLRVPAQRHDVERRDIRFHALRGNAIECQRTEVGAVASIGDELEQLIRRVVKRVAERSLKRQVSEDIDDMFRSSARLFVAGPEGRALIGQAVSEACRTEEMRGAIDWALRDSVMGYVRETVESYIKGPDCRQLMFSLLRDELTALIDSADFARQVEEKARVVIRELLAKMLAERL